MRAPVRDGFIDGVVIIRRGSGTLVAEIPMRNGNIQGLVKRFGDDGEFVWSRVYLLGVPIDDGPHRDAY